MGPIHAEWLATIPESELKAVCDIDENRAKEIASEYQIDWYTDYHEVLERKDIEAVTIVTPNYLHAPMAIEAAKAGWKARCSRETPLHKPQGSRRNDKGDKEGRSPRPLLREPVFCPFI